MYKQKAFTLAELLIALGILGIIAVFTIPKVLEAQQSSKYTAMAKEVVSAVSGAYQTYKLNSSATANTRVDDLTPYLNYVKVDTTSSFNFMLNPGAGSCDGSSGDTCLKLHNGGVLIYEPGLKFNGTDTTNAILFRFDQDSTFKSGDNSLGFFIYFNGRVSSYGHILPNTMNNSVNSPFNPGTDPTWFTWN